MALKIRLRQQGRTNRKLYRLVVTEVTSSRDGRYVEMLGWYNPHETELEKQLDLATDRIEHWLNQGALISDRSIALVERVAPQVIRNHTAKCVAKRQAECAKKKGKVKSAAAPAQKASAKAPVKKAAAKKA